MQRPVAMALVWFFSLGGLGIWFPLYSLYLHENAGLGGNELGGVMAVLPLMGIFAQPLWGQVADVTGSRTRVLALLCFCAAAGYAALALAHGFGALLLGTAALAFFSTAVIPTSVSVTLALGRAGGPRAFGRSRVWGTIGFLVMVVVFPYLLHAWQERGNLGALRTATLSEPGLELMFPLTGALVALAGLTALLLPREGAVSLRAPRGDWKRLLRHQPYLRLLFFSLVAFMCLQGPQMFFPVFVRSHGGSVDTVSRMWILMLLLEIPLIALSGATLERVGARGLLGIGVLAGGLRWAVCGFAPDLVLVWPVQLLHGVVVAGLVIGGPLYVEQAVPERLRSTGQGVLAMVGFGVGGISSSLGAGWLLERVGPAAPYAVGGLGALALGLLLPVLLPAPSRPASEPDEAPQESIRRS
jgi:PPP family 3-phenylpropionic acid transporter